MERKKVAENLLNLRNGKTREEVAEEIGISVSTLQMYENAKRIPRDSIKVKLANFYGVTVQSIFFDYQQHELCCFAKFTKEENYD
ncbi:DNA-binding transcriptional regulator, XRE-family HTH domain [Bacillus sp. 5mfcol3.1]|uniref:helix-turn-helix transcriptional regulator n=1 Tax=Bacillus sp. 5mfcol3.1 TaxID=1761756 RepID=UPI0008E4C830|nr:helix-turn-helix transcriptional regulator [Bacillus sp. 5mfcol3.1]SFK73927.1 DNA-binding transcriptional regulator, XRE-family HTH domain [Bacillus sp. 5mfcol3.1]SIQ40935.1 DNA-binding transcriptional regulator, XRE-family HTH domain [Bacillus cereus]